MVVDVESLLASWSLIVLLSLLIVLLEQTILEEQPPFCDDDLNRRDHGHRTTLTYLQCLGVLSLALTTSLVLSEKSSQPQIVAQILPF